MEAVCSIEKSLNFYRTVWYLIPVDNFFMCERQIQLVGQFVRLESCHLVALTFGFHRNASAIHSITGEAWKRVDCMIKYDTPPLSFGQWQVTEKAVDRTLGLLCIQ
jgi:hypothetical protein